MIATLEGVLEYRGDDSVIINVGGIGFRVYVSSSTSSQLGAVKGRVSLYTHLHVREDNISLYGFVSSEELTLFKSLISVTGIGAKLALTLLSALNPGQLVMAITSGDIDLLSRTPGIGKKIASRLVVELRGKLEKEWKEVALPLVPEHTDVIAALTGLGYSVTEAAKAISKIPDSEGLSLEDKVRMALQQMARG
ncbi:MAG: Holliday junction branch migration protein RuvA [Dehalococcoidia bacterium]|nr:Holliday junction branch migration protein RuvA [Dehalococcoidia bacterium]MDH4300355.1 Holliday junction branch migration protein RuvA [Dehalococcoidia bacterium]MDH4366532.1 Holliday junction branch migration protein RuvA [Dehalococcoidia bacterium]